eukprot:Gb_06252 [translate_table: standard]
MLPDCEILHVFELEHAPDEMEEGEGDTIKMIHQFEAIQEVTEKRTEEQRLIVASSAKAQPKSLTFVKILEGEPQREPKSVQIDGEKSSASIASPSHGVDAMDVEETLKVTEIIGVPLKCFKSLFQ